jgi:hypothetical protein
MLGSRMAPFLNQYLTLIIAEKCIDAADVLAIRTVLDEELILDKPILDKLVEVDGSVANCPEWDAFLSEIMANWFGAHKVIAR